MPAKPSSAAERITSTGKWLSRSQASEWGRSCASANLRAMSRIMIRSSSNIRLIGKAPLSQYVWPRIAIERGLMSMRRLPDGYSISGVAADEIPDLIAIDLAASQLFAGTGMLPEEELSDHVPAEVFEAAMPGGHVFVARGPQGRAGGLRADLAAGGYAVPGPGQRGPGPWPQGPGRGPDPPGVSGRRTTGG